MRTNTSSYSCRDNCYRFVMGRCSIHQVCKRSRLNMVCLVIQDSELNWERLNSLVVLVSRFVFAKVETCPMVDLWQDIYWSRVTNNDVFACSDPRPVARVMRPSRIKCLNCVNLRIVKGHKVYFLDTWFMKCQETDLLKHWSIDEYDTSCALFKTADYCRYTIRNVHFCNTRFIECQRTNHFQPWRRTRTHQPKLVALTKALIRTLTSSVRTWVWEKTTRFPLSNARILGP